MIIKLFRFEETYYGKGLFLIFIGLLCSDKVESPKSTIAFFDIIIGSLIILYGIVLIVAAAFGKQPPEPIIKEFDDDYILPF